MVPEDKALLKSHQSRVGGYGPRHHAAQLAAVPDDCDVSAARFLLTR